MAQSKNLLITGGSSGIGLGVVDRSLASGYNVAFTYLQRSDEIPSLLAGLREKYPDRICEAYSVDVGDSAQVESMTEKVLHDFEQIHGLVLSAGISSDGLLVSVSDAEWDRVIKTNLYGCFYCSRALLPHFLTHREGRIVMLSSLNRKGAAGVVAYSASKAALTGLSGTIAKEYGKRGITSNLVAPGFVETSMTVGKISSELESFWMKYCPPGRYAKVDDVASAVLYLLSPGAQFVNGTLIEVTGGLDWRP